ncbi:DUF948 domain-containing protein [Kamptonema sp. UHCC 0994]|uniref:DUF948 domain-containing protein n=1 Tax=Kamptonema sp. UHCC 0994 TaxID=3031329 RepID=UPI0023B93B99|nr:DUF948 domain-containing protein [Kamptonema sp. UHCC 0994]MDF0551734.1 DUF948 domain-containing protein [Kamptonema sp. UHCC 0994]
MTDPVFWLALSIFLVAVSLTAVLIALLPAVQALARAARSVEKLADTLSREFPPTLEAIRLTGMEISELTEDVSEGVQSAGEVVKQVDQTIGSAKKQAQKVQITTRNVFTGFKVAWKTLTRKPATSDRRLERLSPSQRNPISLGNSTLDDTYSEEYTSGRETSNTYSSRETKGELPRPRPREASHLQPNPEELEQLDN